jgi:hypothetical protein
MARYLPKRLTNRNIRLYFKDDDAATEYTLLANGSDFNGPNRTGSTGDGMAYEDEGHTVPTPQTRSGTFEFRIKLNYGQARPTFDVFTIMHLVRVDEDGYGKHVYGQINAVRENRQANGLPEWQGTGDELEDPTDIEPDDVDGFLGI